MLIYLVSVQKFSRPYIYAHIIMIQLHMLYMLLTCTCFRNIFYYLSIWQFIHLFLKSGRAGRQRPVDRHMSNGQSL